MAAKEYMPLRRESEDDLLSKDDGSDFEASVQSQRRNWTTVWLTMILAMSLVANLVALSFWKGVHRDTFKLSAPTLSAKALELPTVYKHFWWNTEYSSVNYTLQNKLWDDILPSHGFVAIDRERALNDNYPESMYLPSDTSKGVYLLESYHQLHCLKILQRTMRESLSKADFTWTPRSHIEHCFDYLLQLTICNADTTPLYSFGRYTAGDGQVHKCKDWNTLRKYATENRACYRDTIEDVPLGQHFGYCDDGEDGIIELSQLSREIDSNGAEDFQKILRAGFAHVYVRIAFLLLGRRQYVCVWRILASFYLQERKMLRDASSSPASVRYQHPYQASADGVQGRMGRIAVFLYYGF